MEWDRSRDSEEVGVRWRMYRDRTQLTCSTAASVCPAHCSWRSQPAPRCSYMLCHQPSKVPLLPPHLLPPPAPLAPSPPPPHPCIQSPPHLVTLLSSPAYKHTLHSQTSFYGNLSNTTNSQLKSPP